MNSYKLPVTLARLDGKTDEKHLAGGVQREYRRQALAFDIVTLTFTSPPAPPHPHNTTPTPSAPLQLVRP